MSSNVAFGARKESVSSYDVSTSECSSRDVLETPGGENSFGSSTIQFPFLLRVNVQFSKL